MRFVSASVKKDLARWWQDSTAILIWLGIPFLIGGLITSMIAGQNGGTPTGVLLIADQDDSVLSGLVAGAYAQDQLGELISVEQVTLDEGEKRIASGDASGFLTIPAGFQDAFLNESPVTLTLKTNPSQIILPGIIQDVTEILLDLGFYAQQLLGDEIARIQSADLNDQPDDVFVSGIAVDIQNKLQSVAPKLFPPIIDIEIVEPPPTEAQPDMALLFLPGVILMAILFSANGLAADYWLERDTGTLRRLVSAPGMLSSFVAGKAIAALVIMGLIAGITLSVGFAYHGVSWTKFTSSLIWVSFAGVGFFAWFAALQMLFSNRRTASLVSSIFLFPLLMAGGSFFPLAALPEWIAAIGRLSPNGFVADKLTNELTAASAWSIDSYYWFIMFAMTISGLAICSWRLKTGFARR
ncbi:MAG: ABC transporter permease [Gammaproteobacteria bacterium]|nr:ABC transporter permease [Gammaproteobacteria bacterium]